MDSNNIAEPFRNVIHDTISFYKSGKDINQAFLRSIVVDDDYRLIPASIFHQSDFKLFELLCRWRNEHVSAFPSQFIATPHGTQLWFSKEIIGNHNRILFLVVDKLGNVVGHIGFNRCLENDNIFEVDNVIRGSKEPPKGLFSKSLETLINWAQQTFPVSSFMLRVMADNVHAINFYRKCNFVDAEMIPLVGDVSPDRKVYRDANSNEKPEKYFLKMNYCPPSFTGDELILTSGPSISAKEAVYVHEAATKGWNKNWSNYLDKFEKSFADYVGVKHALSTSSCTGALQIALMSLGIGPGDEVIVPDQTWVASATAIKYVGATPIFADIEIDTWNLSSKSVESLITEKTKAIVVVHMYGHPARIDQIIALSKKYNLRVVEDSAPAIGAAWNGKRCGSFGDFGAFSFQGAKLLVTGEGGMLVTNNSDLFYKATKIADLGRNPNKTFWIDGEGVKFKMSNLQAAFGLAQLERVDGLIEMKRRIFSWYEEFLSECPDVRLNREVDGARSIYWMTSIFLSTESKLTRDELISKLRHRNIDTRPVFPAISQYPIWPLKQSPQPTAKLVGDQAINLPSGVCLTKSKVKYISENITKLLQRPS